MTKPQQNKWPSRGKVIGVAVALGGIFYQQRTDHETITKDHDITVQSAQKLNDMSDDMKDIKERLGFNVASRLIPTPSPQGLRE